MAYRQGYRPAATQQATRRPASGASGRASAQPARQTARAATPRKKTKKRRSRPLKIFLILALCAFLLTLGIMAYLMYDEVARVEQMDTFYPGVYVDGVSLYGATPQAAYDWLVSRARNELAGWGITLQYGDAAWHIDTDTLGLNTAIDQAVAEEVQKAYLVGRNESSLIDRYRTILSLKTEPYEGYTTSIEKNMTAIDTIVSQVQAAVNKPAVNATITFDFGRKNEPVVTTAEEYGLEVDTVALKNQLIGMINGMESGTIQVEPNVIVPEHTEAALKSTVVLLGYYESPVSSRSTDDRNRNLELGCERIHNTILKPGERFSFNKVVGERTEANGYRPAQEIVSGSYKMGIGGGICQVSSALYNAVIEANLLVKDRTNHGIPVNYLEMGADATVSDGRIDFVFENDTDAPIYIMARLETSSSGKKTCIFQIYGRPDPNGYTYGLRHETVEILPIPEPVREKDKKGEYVLYTDEEKQTFDGAEGAVVRTFLVIKDATGRVVDDSKELYTDTYRAQAPVIYTGVNRRPD